MRFHVLNTSSLARLGSGLATILLGMSSLSVAPVVAATPTIERNVVIDDTTVLTNTSRQCGFEVDLRQFGLLSFKVSTREDGVMTFQEIAGRIAGTYSAPSTGKSITIHVDDAGTNIDTIYPDGREQVMNAGTDGVITVPGYGHVYIGVGLVLVTVEANGDVSEVSVGARDPDHSGVCPLLQ
jgi:hypothetical protein